MFYQTSVLSINRFRLTGKNRKPQIKFALLRGFAKCGKVCTVFTQGCALSDLRLPWATYMSPLEGLSIRLALLAK